MKDLIDLYIDDHKLSWAPSTLKSERHRLYGLGIQLSTLPIQLWEQIQAQKPYSRVTTWTRVTDFWQWLIDNNHIQGENEYAKFRRKNARLFKNAYQTSKPKITFEEAARLINKLPEGMHRNLALQILGSGERYSEAIQREGTTIVGKGSKRRTTYRPKFTESNRTGSYASFRRALASIGLKPHDLRKLLATRLVERGMNEADLMEIMGWSSILTAKAYLQPKKEQALKLVFQTIHEEIK